MNGIAYGQIHFPETDKSLFSAVRRFAVLMADALCPPESRGRTPRETDAELRRRLGRDVPAHLRCDLGLDPDVL